MNFAFKIILSFALIFCANCSLSVNGEINQTRTEKDEAALTAAKQNIEKYRQGNARIRLQNFEAENLTIKIRQLSHNFKFGCYLKIDGLTSKEKSIYENYFNKLFNYAVIGTYWDVTENQRGEYFWKNFENEAAMANRNNWKIQVAPILWGSNQAGTPKWLPTEKADLQKTIENRIQRYFENYPNTADEIELVNETLSPEPDIFANRLGETYFEKAFRDAKRISPKSRLLHNEYGVFGTVSANNYNKDRFFDLITSMKNKEIPFDIIGIQAHANREWYSPSNVAKQLNHYAVQNKPIQITEFSVQTKNYDNRNSYERILGNYRSGIWTDAKQAEFYEEFYTVAFGNPNVEAIIQWGLDDKRAWLPGIGLIDENNQPKPNYKILDRLINQKWRTNLELKINSRQEIEFRGFFGVYEIEVLSKDKILTKATFKLKKDSPNNFTISN